ncbi:hypothetical protein [Vibrio crassostreae]|uniref:hypothetical protein n=1 Tax=Vibrio crassostreae TaxID=246167 RepID=UPI001B316B50|nr:hypothetical protein [Vibrio crassostreae]
MKNFPHVITANNVQEAARTIQESYKKKHGEKLKRSSLLLGLSEALKYANKNVMEAKNGTVAIHKDIPVWVAAEYYMLDGNYDGASVSVFVGNSEREVCEKMYDSVITDFLGAFTFDASELIERMSRLNDFPVLRYYAETELNLDTDKAMGWTLDELTEFCEEAKGYSLQMKESIFKTITNSLDISGAHTVENISMGIVPEQKVTLPEVQLCDNDGHSMVLTGIVPHNLSFGLSDSVLSDFIFDSETRKEDDYIDVMQGLHFAYSVVNDHPSNDGLTVALAVTLTYESEHTPFPEELQDLFLNYCI